MLVNAGKAGWRYGSRMVSMLFRLLAVASFLLMPLAMMGVPAAAADRAAAATSMPCDGHDEPADEAPEGKSHCGACVALAQPLPAASAAATKPAAALIDRNAGLLLGHAPEVATPPPKLARSSHLANF